MDRENDRRHTERDVGLVMFRRFYSLAKIGKGLVLFGGVAGLVGGCFAYSLQIVGKKVVPVDEEFRRTAVRYDSLATIDRQNIHYQLDTLRTNQEFMRDQLALVGLVSCAQLRSGAPDWLQEKCRQVLREGRNLP